MQQLRLIERTNYVLTNDHKELPWLSHHWFHSLEKFIKFTHLPCCFKSQCDFATLNTFAQFCITNTHKTTSNITFITASLRGKERMKWNPLLFHWFSFLTERQLQIHLLPDALVTFSLSQRTRLQTQFTQFVSIEGVCLLLWPGSDLNVRASDFASFAKRKRKLRLEILLH